MRPVPTESTAELVEGFLAGSGDAHATVRRWIEPIVHHRGWRFADAEAVVQDVLIKLLALLRAGRFDPSAALKPFASAVARNTCIDAYRRERFRAGFETPASEDRDPSDLRARPDEELLEGEQRAQLRYVFQRLSEDCRTLWRWVYFEDCSSTEVAERLGIRAGAARARLHRCLERARSIGRQLATAEEGAA